MEIEVETANSSKTDTVESSSMMKIRRFKRTTSTHKIPPRDIAASELNTNLGKRKMEIRQDEGKGMEVEGHQLKKRECLETRMNNKFEQVQGASLEKLPTYQ